MYKNSYLYCGTIEGPRDNYSFAFLASPSCVSVLMFIAMVPKVCFAEVKSAVRCM